MRFSLPPAASWCTSPRAGYQGQATDIMIHARETQKLKDRLNEIYVRHNRAADRGGRGGSGRDNFMSAEDAKAWGLIDEILENRARRTTRRSEARPLWRGFATGDDLTLLKARGLA